MCAFAPAATRDQCCSLDSGELTSERTWWGESPLSADDSDISRRARDCAWRQMTAEGWRFSRLFEI